VTTDRTDAAEGRIAQSLPGIRWFLDYDHAVSVAYGAVAGKEEAYAPCWVLLDPMLRLCERHPLGDGERAMARVRQARQVVPTLPAPVLIVPGVLLPEMCRHLISLYEQGGG
jgi:hypothetical protein